MQRWSVRLLVLTITVSLVSCSTKTLVTQSVPDDPDQSGSQVSEKDSDYKHAVLDQILEFVTTSPELESTREFYGDRLEKRIALVNSQDYGVAWPSDYRPKLPGFEVVFANENIPVPPLDRHLLGVRIDKLNLKQSNRIEDQIGLHLSPIDITLMNVGGSYDDEGTVIGGAHVYFVLNWKSLPPTIVFSGAMD